MQIKKPNYYNKNIKNIYTPVKVNDTINDFIRKQSENILHFIDDNIQKKLRSFISTIKDKLYRYLGGETGSVKCLSHGDFRINNFLIKEIDSETSEAILVDYQMLFLGSPVLDLLHFLIIGANRV